MDLDAVIERMGRAIDRYAMRAHAVLLMGVAAASSEKGGVPPDMQVGEIDSDGWVRWRVLPSSLSLTDLVKLEGEFGVRLPTLLKGYLLARAHLFDEVRSSRHDQQIFMTSTPSNDPLREFRDLLLGWKSLLSAGYLPFAQWGDGWGPMCFDVGDTSMQVDDAPVVWFDHEELIPLGDDACSDRVKVEVFAKPVLDSFSEFIDDVFHP